MSNVGKVQWAIQSEDNLKICSLIVGVKNATWSKWLTFVIFTLKGVEKNKKEGSSPVCEAEDFCGDHPILL